MFDPDKLYWTNDPALKQLGTYSTLAHWRHQGKGPAFVKCGKRILYRGSALNAWLEAQTVEPTPAAA